MRFYLPTISKDLALTGDTHTHAAYSLRIRVSDQITVFDGNGTEYLCKVTEIKKDRTCLEILNKKTEAGETTKNYTLFLAVIKQDRFELAVQKATELGVNRIVPVYSTYTQRLGSLNYERFKKIAVSACEQCGRSRVPVIEQAIEFDELVERAAKTFMIFPWEREMHGALLDAIDRTQSDISVSVGTEGGITQEEKERLCAVGAKSVTLGPRILRAETAAITMLSVLSCEMGEWKL